MFQQLFLWPHLTLRENILLPARNIGGDIDARVEELIDLFAMHDFIDRYPSEASGGQKQRTALARALILNPTYLLLDEITSALDVEQISRILSCLQQLKERGIGIFIITHLINFARKAADQILFIDKGEIQAHGGPEIMTTPNNARLSEFLSLVAEAS